MNIFYLDHDPETCAQLHCDKHVIKMILEYAQLLSTTHHMMNSEVAKSMYKKTHFNHPSAVWTRSSKENYKWLLALFKCLCKEYTKRYGKIHKTQGYTNFFEIVPENLPDHPFTQPAKAMPVEYQKEDSLESYRLYYLYDKFSESWFHFKLGIPEFWKNEMRYRGIRYEYNE